EWPFVDGQLRMVTNPLDVEGLLGEAEAGAAPPAGTVIGHVHLRVAEIEAVRAFYVDVLGFTLTQRFGPGAIFVAAGSYHHHIGLNIWETADAPPPPPGAVGLRAFVVQLPDRAAVDALADRLRASAIRFEEQNDSVRVADPASNVIVFRTYF